jgi:peptide/nickel transport system permease protein
MVGQPTLWPGESAAFPLGTDMLGRDIAAEIFHGARISLLIGFVAAAMALSIGVLVGSVAGYCRGKFDDLLMRVTEFFRNSPGRWTAQAIRMSAIRRSGSAVKV